MDSSFFSAVTRKWDKKGDDPYQLNKKTYDFFRLSKPIYNVLSFFKARETINLLTEFRKVKYIKRMGVMLFRVIKNFLFGTFIVYL